MTTKNNVVAFRKRSNITMGIHEDAERYCFEIDFKPNQPDLPDCELKTEGLGITLTVWKNGDKPSVGLWTGRGEHEFGDETVESFRNFITFATGRTSFADYNAKKTERIERVCRPYRISSGKDPHPNPPGAA